MRKGFTLLELVIVIIIIGVLASLALSKLFALVERSRSVEAIAAIASIRGSLESCYLLRNGTYAGCDFCNMSLENPENSPGSLFGYRIVNTTQTGYRIEAEYRKKFGTCGECLTGLCGAPSTGNAVFFEKDGNSINLWGTGFFEGV